jgi:hypothetical protein
MDIINRIKNVLITPKTEWSTIEAENSPHLKVFTNFFLPLALITAIAAFIGWGLIGYRVWGVHVSSMSMGIRQAISLSVTLLGGVYLTAIVINMLAGTFNAKSDFDRAFSLTAFSYTPMLVAGIFYILPSLSWIASLAGLYSLYILYIGFKPMMKVPDDKQTVYFVVSLISMVAIWIVLGIILSAILMRGLYGF